MKGCSIYRWYVEEPHESHDVMLTNNDSSYVLRCPNMSLMYHSSYYVNFNLQLLLILTCMVRWMHDVLIESKTMQYASAKCLFYCSICLLMGGKESVFLLFQNQNSFQSTVMNIKSKTSKYFYKPNSYFRKKMGRVRISFLKRTTPSTPTCQRPLIFQIS